MRSLLLLFGLLVPAVSIAHGPATALRVVHGPKIDGRLDEELWQHAPDLGPFTQQAPDEGKAPSQPTSVRVVYDDHAIYFGIRCGDSEPAQIIDNLTRRDRNAFSDGVMIDLDTRGRHESAFHFEVSAAGVQRDAVRTGDEALNFDWDAVWSSAVHREVDGWTAEIAVPYTALRFPDAEVSEWYMEVRRFIARRNETDLWAFIPREDHGELLRYARIDGLSHLPQPRRLELVPFVLGRARLRRSPLELGLPRGFDLAGSAGLDARYGLTSGLTLDATVLPDFGQVEADQVVLNLTTFELVFPEKRPFFLEGTDLYALQDVYGDPLSTQLFYSRRVGAPAPGATVPTGGQLLDAPESVRILGAAKLTGRLGEKLTLAVLDGVTSAEHAALAAPDGVRANQGLAPLSNYAIGRVRYALLDNAGIGATVTGVLRDEKPGQLVFQGACPDGEAPGTDDRCTHHALGAAIDVGWHSSDGTYVLSAMLLASRLFAGPTRVLPDATAVGPGSQDLGYRLQFARPAGHLRLDAVFESYGPHLDINDAGYLQQQNLRRLFTRIAWREFDRGPTRDTELGLELFGRNDYDGVRLARGIQLNNATTWANSWTTWIELQRYPRTFDNRELRDGFPYERIDQYGLQLTVASNPARALSFELDSEVRNTWRGFSLTVSGGMVARPLSRMELSLLPTLERVTGDPRWVETVAGSDGTPTCRIGMQDAAAPGATLRGTFTFNPKLTLQAYAQLFFASVRYGQIYEAQGGAGRSTVHLADLAPTSIDPGAYEEHDAVLNVNVVLRWEYLPGSVLYLVYTRAQNGGLAPEQVDAAGRPVPHPRFDLGSLGRGPIESVVLLKASYYWAL